MIGTHSEVERRVSFEGLGGHALQLLLANALLALCAKIAIPLPGTPVPLTLQTFGVMLIAVLFGARTSALAAVLYLIEGAAGLPVFQPFGSPAAARLFGPTAGYLMAFPPAAFITGRLVELLSTRVTGDSPSGARVATRNLAGWIAVGAALVPGQVVVFVCGWAWLASLIGATPAFTQGVLPFLPGEVVKLVAAAAIARSVRVKV